MCARVLPGTFSCAGSSVAHGTAGPELLSGLSEGRAEQEISCRAFFFFFMLWVIVCASAFLNKMPLSSL